MAALTDYDCTRYGRQMMIGGWGVPGQERLKRARVFIVGAGGLGSPVALYLAAAGVGTIGLGDCDRPDLSNLNRQILYTDADLGRPKAEVAAEVLRRLNPAIAVNSSGERIAEHNIERIVGPVDLILDCLDNFDTRYVLNAYSVRHSIPLIHAAIWGLSGQITVLHPPRTPCLRCIFPDAPPREVFPVAGVTPGLAGCLQATEALKLLTGLGASLLGKLLVFDAEQMTFTTLTVERRPDCPACAGLIRT
ncbi:MAG: HesA/MoeB/ThiF family protein [Kiritimatiellaeota bacterium]|nr:HesA/MoeB/ThiF family protein [Kiritimatiellota bacterium]